MSTVTLLTTAGAVRVAGENLVIDLREFPETPATSSQPVTAPGRMTSSPSVRVPHSSNDAIGEVKGSARLPNASGVEPSLPEADAGGPVSASDPHSAPRDPGPIPTWMDRRAKKDAA